MRNSKRLVWRFLAVILILAALGGGGWLWYDHNVDRSGWSQKDGYTYYLDFHAKPTTGWLEMDGGRYYFNPEGHMVTGWEKLGGMRLHFDGDGKQSFDWRTIDGADYYFGVTGEPLTGWQQLDGSSFYFDRDGIAASGWETISGSRYFFGDDHAMVTGWLTQDETTFYLDTDGHMVTGLLTMEDGTRYFEENGALFHGWIDLGKNRYYFDDDGIMVTGWVELNDKRFFFEEDGIMQRGWHQEGEYRYYLTEDGSAATSPTEIDGEMCYFSPKGIYVLLVNYNHPVPENYDPDLVSFGSFARVSRVAEPHLKQMMADCEAQGINCWLNCGYRSQSEQTQILRERTEEYQKDGMSHDSAYRKALETVAVPGFSEHQIGLAMDIVCSKLTNWLIDNCWDYGFILRYPEDKADITHITYEFWHFRYVGTEVSLDMKDTGLCLEEYLGAA